MLGRVEAHQMKNYSQTMWIFLAKAVLEIYSLSYIFLTVMRGKLLLSMKMRGVKKGYHLCCLDKI